MHEADAARAARDIPHTLLPMLLPLTLDDHDEVRRGRGPPLRRARAHTQPAAPASPHPLTPAPRSRRPCPFRLAPQVSRGAVLAVQQLVALLPQEGAAPAVLSAIHRLESLGATEDVAVQAARLFAHTAAHWEPAVLRERTPELLRRWCGHRSFTVREVSMRAAAAAPARRSGPGGCGRGPPSLRRRSQHARTRPGGGAALPLGHAPTHCPPPAPAPRRQRRRWRAASASSVRPCHSTSGTARCCPGSPSYAATTTGACGAPRRSTCRVWPAACTGTVRCSAPAARAAAPPAAAPATTAAAATTVWPGLCAAAAPAAVRRRAQTPAALPAMRQPHAAEPLVCACSLWEPAAPTSAAAPTPARRAPATAPARRTCSGAQPRSYGARRCGRRTSRSLRPPPAAPPAWASTLSAAACLWTSPRAQARRRLPRSPPRTSGRWPGRPVSAASPRSRPPPTRRTATARQPTAP
jgi:pyruvate/2-oxoglutarate dehydrogenase complex dihydrolipoamide acyltransferase (E2) component